MTEADDFRARMEILAEHAGNLSELARKSGLSRRVIDKYRNGESEPSRARLVALAQAGGVRIEWLAVGTGPMRDGDALRQPLVEAACEGLNEALLEAAIAASAAWTSARQLQQSPQKFAALCLSLYRMLRRQYIDGHTPLPDDLSAISMRILDDLGPILGH